MAARGIFQPTPQASVLLFLHWEYHPLDRRAALSLLGVWVPEPPKKCREEVRMRYKQREVNFLAEL